MEKCTLMEALILIRYSTGQEDEIIHTLNIYLLTYLESHGCCFCRMKSNKLVAQSGHDINILFYFVTVMNSPIMISKDHSSRRS